MRPSISDIAAAHRSGAASPVETIRHCYERIRRLGDPGIFITLRNQADAEAEAGSLSEERIRGPLSGVPVAIKDNIDVAGMPTTAACPAFAYDAREDAFAVARLRAAGAIVIGKTNLDQFATGLNGLRTPYPAPRNALRPDIIPGGSSSGSAVAVAAGLVPLALGTDTAGSGRIPAMLNNIVGLKPSLGLISARGVVPACRTLDCVSILAATTEEAWAALKVLAVYDRRDPYARERPLGVPTARAGMTIGVPGKAQREFFGDTRAAADYETALKNVASLGSIVEIDMAALFEAARLLYEGPWVAERYLAARRLIEENPAAMHPVTREIIAGGARPRAIDAFAAFYRLEELRRAASELFATVDALALPTAPTAYACEQMLGDPIELNSRLGIYTNFVNLLDMCGVAVPAALHPDRSPFGITFLAPGGADDVVASLAKGFETRTGLAPGAPS